MRPPVVNEGVFLPNSSSLLTTFTGYSWAGSLCTVESSKRVMAECVQCYGPSHFKGGARFIRRLASEVRLAMAFADEARPVDAAELAASVVEMALNNMTLPVRSMTARSEWVTRLAVRMALPSFGAGAAPPLDFKVGLPSSRRQVGSILRGHLEVLRREPYCYATPNVRCKSVRVPRARGTTLHVGSAVATAPKKGWAGSPPRAGPGQRSLVFMASRPRRSQHGQHIR